MPYTQNTLDRINDIVNLFNETLVEEGAAYGVEISGFRIELSELDGGKALGTVTQEWDDDPGDPSAWHLEFTTSSEIRENQREKNEVANYALPAIDAIKTGTLES